ncbi:Lipase member I [Pseudolycoriella hygida]|uniref:Lipase member I n=1 Tax=Pseudolycoriella hygida TaxID=35572 RepID=A0A9Q0RXY4_9DIPT|nr:Lipase member I [Pseudolycoriella hygida]
MKTTCLVFALFLAAIAANPIFQSEEIGEEHVPVKEEDWQLVPDSEGHMHLVDINNVDMEAEPAFNPDTDVIFRLWTRQNPTAGQIVTLGNNAQLAASNFVASRQTRFHAHGWNGGGPNTGALVRSALLEQLDCNVFVVDWGAGAQTPNYIAARNRVNPVGNVVGRYIIWINSHGTPYSIIGTIGHSLGAHVAGAAGKTTPQLIRSVVGLDPAGPLFSLDSPANRLDAGDGVYVESIITDAGRLGFQHPIGHGNFYPNWGTSQPGCGIDLTGNCGHGLVNNMYASSINNANHFGATRCTGLAAIQNRNCPQAGPSGRMGGEPVDNSGNLPVGTVFFLPTTGTHPFAQGPR